MRKCPKVMCICKFCKKEFFIYPSMFKKGEGKYCSKKCYESFLKTRSTLVKCIICHKIFKIYKWFTEKGKYKCCSKKCADEFKRVFNYKSKKWNGGKYIDPDGYIQVKIHNHPYADKQNYVGEHRLIVEKIMRKYIPISCPTHHINKVRTDNHPNNLMIFINKSAHNRFHHNPDTVKPEEIIFDGSVILSSQSPPQATHP